MRPNPSLEPGPPPAWHLAREALWSIVRLAGQAPFRLRPLSSNVRPHIGHFEHSRNIFAQRRSRRSGRRRNGRRGVARSHGCVLVLPISVWPAPQLARLCGGVASRATTARSTACSGRICRNCQRSPPSSAAAARMRSIALRARELASKRQCPSEHLQFPRAPRLECQRQARSVKLLCSHLCGQRVRLEVNFEVQHH